ncbi:Tn3 family transposase [Spirillospora sp. NPDC050679]
MFARGGRPTPPGRALAEYGRIDKTLHLLYILGPIDDGYRRTLNKRLTVQEARHRLAPQDLSRCRRSASRVWGRCSAWQSAHRPCRRWS